MISDIIGIPYDILKDNIMLDINEIPITRKDEKFKECDFIVRVGNNIIINIELNVTNYMVLGVKNLSYIFSLFANSGKVGKKYNSDLELIQINLNTFSEGDDELNVYGITNLKNGSIYFDNLKIFSLDVVKCGEIWYSCDNKGQLRNYIKWGAMLSCDNINDIHVIMEDVLQEEEIEELESRLEGIRMDANGIMTKKEAREWGEWIRNSISYDVGMEFGITRGFEQANINNVKAMLKNNADYEFISKVSGKNIEEIKDIEKSMKD